MQTVLYKKAVASAFLINIENVNFDFLCLPTW